MDQTDLNRRLSRISTVWSMVRQAHHGVADRVAAAQQLLIERYGGAVYRYLLGALRDADAADEVFQEFAVRFVRGDFRRADPERGRFRDFVKTAVYHLVVDFQKQRRRRLPPIPQDAAEPVATADAELDLDRQFLAGWREELLARAWDVLAETEPTQHAVLRFRAEHPDLPSPEMAERLSKQLGRPFTATAVRVTLHRARERFAGLLLDEVVRSLQSASREQIEHELIDLGLWDYCRAAFQQCGP